MTNQRHPARIQTSGVQSGLMFVTYQAAKLLPFLSPTLPIGVVPAALLGQLADVTRHASPLPPCRVQFVAELTGQVVFAATSHTSVPPRLSATVPSYDRLTRSTRTQRQLTTGACSNFPGTPFSGLPIGGKRGIPSSHRVSPQQLPKWQFVAEPAGSRTIPLSTCSTLSTG